MIYEATIYSSSPLAKVPCPPFVHLWHHAGFEAAPPYCPVTCLPMVPYMAIHPCDLTVPYCAFPLDVLHLSIVTCMAMPTRELRLLQIF